MDLVKVKVKRSFQVEKIEYQDIINCKSSKVRIQKSKWNAYLYSDLLTYSLCILQNLFTQIKI